MADNSVGTTRRRATIADVASRAGVSPGAVSFALNDRPGVASETRERILAAAGELGWSPSHRGRSLSKAASFTVGLVLTRSADSVAADPFFPAFIAGVNTALAPQQQSLLFTVVPDHQEELRTYRRLAAEQRVDGVIVADLRIDDERPALLAELGLPAVTLGRPARRAAGIGAVSVDDIAGMHEVVGQLLDLGHQDIAHVTGPKEYIHVQHRKDAWRSALTAAGAPAGRCRHTDFSARSGARATAELLRTGRRPTAITYTNDVMAIAGIATLHRHRLRVPKDVSVTGFDDTELARYVEPALTSVRTDVAGWGAQAAEALLALIGGGPPPDVQLPPTRMVSRASTARPTARRGTAR
jgi:DNA-binding LacI/PurR family transcriptional regulator